VDSIDKLIIEKAKQIQESNGYSDTKMANLIGYRRETYNQIKNGVKPVGAVFYRGILTLLENNGNGLSSIFDIRNESNNNRGRYSPPINRKTKETDISVELNIDGTGKHEINNGLGMFDHLLSQLAQHGRFDLKVSASGSDQHHLIEDVAICLGQALNQALGDKRGIVRMGDATVTMDEALATVAVDISGRGYAILDLPFSKSSEKWQLLGFPPDLISHFLKSFAVEAKLNLYAQVLNGTDDHHKAEAVFKALGRALDKATRIDPRIAGELPTTKGLLER